MKDAWTEQGLRSLAARWMPRDWDTEALSVLTDASDYFRVEYGDILLLENRPYLIRNSAREGRFGLDEEVKHWVKRAIDLDAGELCILKLEFYEKFTTRVGGVRFDCFRSPRKESRILELVAHHPNFMHGKTARDETGHWVRVLEYIPGKTLGALIEEVEAGHEAYFHDTLPEVLRNFMQCLEAIRFLHENGEKHGDIRRDHIRIDRQENRYRWIDFDYNYRHHEDIYSYDLFGLGNILVFIVGKGDVTLHELKRNGSPILSKLADEDLNIVFNNRVANLKRIYPYVPEELNRVLLHFSKGANWHYEHTSQLLEDLAAAIAGMQV